VTDTVTPYDRSARELAARYESVKAEAVHGAFAASLPRGDDRLALDVGAGSGRDAAWLASLGFDVVAVEPSAAMRREGRSRHPEPAIRWIDDRLPALDRVHQLGLGFDLILVSAVWMHVAPPDRPRAFRKLSTLLKPGGVMLISLRGGPPDTGRPMWPVTLGEIEALAQAQGLAIQKTVEMRDQLGRDAVCWTSVCLRLPDDGAGALPLIRGIILNDDKASTYKLGLLRAVARIADTAPALAVHRPDADVVDVPLGLVALFWVRLYLPLVAAGLPQRPGNRGPERLGFAKDGFRTLLAERVVAQDLRIGARFVGFRAAALAMALAEARTLIAAMPAHYTTYPNSDRTVFEVRASRAPRPPSDLILDGEFLRSFGWFAVPGGVWRSLQRLGAWVEPVLVGEWSRLMRGYGERMRAPAAPAEIERALTWIDAARDTSLARAVTDRLIAQDGQLACVWSGVALRSPEAVDIDHCLPWSAWPCGDLWNLMPASRRVNQHLKKDRLPSMQALSAAREPILAWWRRAWLDDPALCERFGSEAAAALSVSAGADPDAVFDGLAWRRLRLRQDQQVVEWSPGIKNAPRGSVVR
jgi:SAM-dependent methyltransferase